MMPAVPESEHHQIFTSMIRCKNAIKGPYWVGDTKINNPLPPGWLPGDFFDQETQTLTRSKHPPIVGIVDLTNRTRYGFSNKGTPQYLFFPLNPAYPPMIVGSRAPTVANQFGIVRFESWDPNTSKWPRGALQELLGVVGDETVELRALRLNINHLGRPTKHDPVCEPYSPCGPLIAWEACFNIDPPGCKDVDDVVSWRRLENGTWEFGIHIANVAAWIPSDSPLDKEAQQKGQTVYEDGHVLYPMFPPEISEKTASLLADGKPRPVVSAIWTFNQEMKLISRIPRWEKTQLIVQNAFTYESILNPENTEKANTLQQFLSVLLGEDVGSDPHRWIEMAMLTYNSAAAEELFRKGHGILRRHAGLLTSAPLLKSISEQTGCNEIAFLGFSSGEYVGISENKHENEYFHSGLQKSLYCHASSPLRRYSDLVNQRLLLGILTEIENSSTLANHLSDRAKAVKQFERAVWCLKTLKPSTISEANGYVLGWKLRGEDVILRVYVPQWKQTVKLFFFPDSDGQEKERICVRTRDTSTSVTFQTGDSISIRAYCNLRKAQWSERFIFSFVMK
jgi:hypothetical protein